MEATSLSALRNDPWNSDDPSVIVTIADRGIIQAAVSFQLANGPGTLLKCEMKDVGGENSRLTYRLDSGELYRIVQWPYRESEPSNSYLIRYKGRTIIGRDKGDGLLEFSEVAWIDIEFGEIEIASERLDIDALLEIAEKVIDASAPSPGLGSRK